ncbi:glycosyltransferase family 4 protein [Clavibacter tessellarius]|uniref:glycosyltransferase family 4 protein n=1 Tax=Clavibacter tessellarius TaxID=31965 RepID=UPI0039ED1A80
MSSLRALLVMDYEFSYLGGAQTAVIQQALALARAGHPVTVVSPDATSAPELQGTGIALHDITPTYRMRFMGLPLIRADAATRADLERLMEGSGTDLVITHSEHGLAAAALAVARGRGIPTMHTVHTFFLRGPAWAGFLTPVATGMHRFMTGLPAPRVRLAPRRLDSALRGLTLAVCREADLVLSPSRHQAVALRDAGLPAVEVVSNTSCATRAEPAPLPAGGPLRLVWAARFAPEKRLRVMLDAMAVVAERAGPGVLHLDLAGGVLQGPAPPGVTLHGRVPTAAVTALLRDAHAAVVTSLGFDNQPMIAMEAFAEGRPVIVSDPVLGAEFADAALLANGTDAEGLAAALIRLARDRRLLEDPAEAASRLAASVSPAAHARSIESALLRIASSRRGSPSA